MLCYNISNNTHACVNFFQLPNLPSPSCLSSVGYQNFMAAISPQVGVLEGIMATKEKQPSPASPNLPPAPATLSTALLTSATSLSSASGLLSATSASDTHNNNTNSGNSKDNKNKKDCPASQIERSSSATQDTSPAGQLQRSLSKTSLQSGLDPNSSTCALS